MDSWTDGQAASTFWLPNKSHFLFFEPLKTRLQFLLQEGLGHVRFLWITSRPRMCFTRGKVWTCTGSLIPASFIQKILTGVPWCVSLCGDHRETNSQMIRLKTQFIKIDHDNKNTWGFMRDHLCIVFYVIFESVRLHILNSMFANFKISAGTHISQPNSDKLAVNCYWNSSLLESRFISQLNTNLSYWQRYYAIWHPLQMSLT